MSLSAEQLFLKYFFPLYPEEAKKDLVRARSDDANPAKNKAIYEHLEDIATTFVRRAEAVFGEDLLLDFSDASVHRLSAALTRERRDEWLASAPAGSSESTLFNVVIHGAIYVGACVVRNHGGEWSMRRPLWESVVELRSRAGDAKLAIFSWWLKSLADDELDASFEDSTSLADRYRAYVEMPCARPEDLPFIAPPDRALPRITKVRYDVFYKYLKAHLPEIRDVGEHFPSAERFEEFGFKWLDFKLLGDGRMLLLSGLGASGLHLFWLTKGGFEKGVFYTCENFPEPLVKAEGEKLVVTISVDKRPVRHEMLYWGP